MRIEYIFSPLPRQCVSFETSRIELLHVRVDDPLKQCSNPYRNRSARIGSPPHTRLIAEFHRRTLAYAQRRKSNRTRECHKLENGGRRKGERGTDMLHSYAICRFFLLLLEYNGRIFMHCADIMYARCLQVFERSKTRSPAKVLRAEQFQFTLLIIGSVNSAFSH